MARKLFIAGNWKMNHNVAETKAMLGALVPMVADIDTIDIAICPVATSLAAAVEATAGSNVAVGSQNVHYEASGAYTGELSCGMLLEIPVKYAIIGHSERRQYFGETDETVNKRVRAALAAGLLPIMCCGESLEQRQSEATTEVVTRQVRAGLADISAADVVKVTIAYEPIWAIGTGLTASPAQAQDVHKTIRDLLVELYGAATAARVRIQYGGSVKASNVAELMSQEDIDGALVGGASLKARDFSDLLHNAL